MVHSVEELVLVDAVAEDEVRQGGEEDLPAAAEDGVDETDNEDEQSRGEVKAVAEDGGLD